MLTQLFDALAPFEPTLVGSFPLGLQVAGSDIDVICHAAELADFERVLAAWLMARAITAHDWTRDGSRGAVSVRFDGLGTPIEVYCEKVAVLEQLGFRHLLIEGRLLTIGGAALRSRVRTLKAGGLKTEPAFARVLGIEGDPYSGLLELEGWPHERLCSLVHGGRANGIALKQEPSR